MSISPHDILMVELHHATQRQILIALYHKITRMETKVTQLSEAVNQLKTSVAELAETVNTQVEPLKQALADAQQQLTDFEVADDIEDTEFRTQIAQLTDDVGAKIQEAQDAVDSIGQAVDQIQQVRDQIDQTGDASASEPPPDTGEDGDTGVDQPPATDTGEQPRRETPHRPDTGVTDPTDQPHPDQTLPGDLPADDAPAEPGGPERSRRDRPRPRRDSCRTRRREPAAGPLAAAEPLVPVPLLPLLEHERGTHRHRAERQPGAGARVVQLLLRVARAVVDRVRGVVERLRRRLHLQLSTPAARRRRASGAARSGRRRSPRSRTPTLRTRT